MERINSVNFPEGENDEKARFRLICDLLGEFIDKNPGFLTNQIQAAIDKGKLLPLMYELASERP